MKIWMAIQEIKQNRCSTSARASDKDWSEIVRHE
jgi:hypothetical protein